MKRSGSGLIIALGLCVLPAFAGKVTYPVNYVCDPQTISQSLCDALNSTLGAEYSDLFGATATAKIYIQMGTLDAGVIGHTFQFYSTVDYSTYYNALKGSINGTADVEALASLPAAAPFGNPINPNYNVSLTSALDAALGLGGGVGACAPGTPSCGAGCGFTLSNGLPNTNCYNGVVTISGSKLVSFYGAVPNASGVYDLDSGTYSPGDYDFFTVVQHETDEVLGTGSCLQGGTLQVSHMCLNGVWGISPADLFRYIAPAQRGFTIGANQAVTLSGPGAYFSIDGGQTSIAGLYNSSNGPDYGDLSTVCQHVQDAIGCSNWTSTGHQQGVTLTNDGGVEIAMLDAIGYSLTSGAGELSTSDFYAPEPSSLGLAAVGFGLSGVIWRRRQRG